VVLGEEDGPLVGLELLADERGHPELLVDPQRHGLAEEPERAREGRDVGGEHPLELQQRLVVEADGVELLGPMPASRRTYFTARLGKSESCFFG
jgi:hypothetical protein